MCSEVLATATNDSFTLEALSPIPSHFRVRRLSQGTQTDELPPTAPPKNANRRQRRAPCQNNVETADAHALRDRIDNVARVVAETRAQAQHRAIAEWCAMHEYQRAAETCRQVRQ